MSLVNFRIIVDLEEIGDLTFHQWLPHKANEVIRIESNGVRLELSFPPALSHRTLFPDDDVSRLTNVVVSKALVDIYVEHWTDELIEFSKLHPNERNLPPNNGRQRELVSEFEVFGTLIATIINKIVASARSIKGQYWIKEFEDVTEKGYSLVNQATMLLIHGDDEPSIFRLGAAIKLRGSMPDVPRLIGRDDWPKMLDFIKSNARPPLVGSLLANARELFLRGYRRSSLLEAVTALEVALGEHTNRLASASLPDDLAKRIDTKSIKSLVEKVGLRGAFGIVIPLIFSEEEISTDTVSKCHAAILARHSVIHNGQRDVSEQRLHDWLQSIETCCKFLAGTT